MSSTSSKPSHCSSLVKNTDPHIALRKHLKELHCIKRACDLDEQQLEIIYHKQKECTHFKSDKDRTYTQHTVKALVNQKIVIIKKGDLKKLPKEGEFPIEFEGNKKKKRDQKIMARLVRASEFPNHASEYKGTTYTILIEWTGEQEFGTLSKMNGIDVIKAAQLDNISINEGGGAGNRPPGEPIVEGDSAATTPFPVQCDYRQIRQDYTVGAVHPGSITVAVMDTGSLFLKSPYTSSQDHTDRSLPLVKREAADYPYGFCSLTKYLDRDYRKHMSKSTVDSSMMDIDDVLGNPYDDTESRHGTTVSAIIAKASSQENGLNTDVLGVASNAAILPVKCFDYLGASTLFDVLCAFNYIFSRIRPDNIRVVNASWGMYMPKDKSSSLSLLRKKIVALQKEQVFFVTSAGNRPNLDSEAHNLEKATMYPACFSSSSNKLKNLITVTTVAAPLPEKDLEDTSHQLQAVENYSSKFVDIGVVGHSVEGLFSSPFKDRSGKNTAPAVINGSSFAAAYVSKYLAQALLHDPSLATKDDFFKTAATIKQTASLKKVTANGRYMQLPTEEYEQCNLYIQQYASSAVHNGQE